MSEALVRIRLLFADEGSFHQEELSLPVASLEAHDRLIDLLQEDPGLLKRVHLDLARLCAAWVVDEE